MTRTEWIVFLAVAIAAIVLSGLLVTWTLAAWGVAFAVLYPIFVTWGRHRASRR
jgi:hypothetical protein